MTDSQVKDTGLPLLWQKACKMSLPLKSHLWIHMVPPLEKIWLEFSPSEMLALLKPRMPVHGEMRLPECTSMAECFASLKPGRFSLCPLDSAVWMLSCPPQKDVHLMQWQKQQCAGVNGLSAASKSCCAGGNGQSSCSSFKISLFCYNAMQSSADI